MVIAGCFREHPSQGCVKRECTIWTTLDESFPAIVRKMIREASIIALDHEVCSNSKGQSNLTHALFHSNRLDWRCLVLVLCSNYEGMGGMVIESG